MAEEHKGHRQRILQEFRDNGIDHFPDHKVLELLLFYAYKRGDTNIIGHNLIEKFGSYSGVFDAEYSMLLEVDGIGEQSATLIKFFANAFVRYMNDYSSQHNLITDAESAKKFVAYKFLTKTVECIYVICLAPDGRVRFSEQIAVGVPENVSVDYKNIAFPAIKMDCSRVIIAHNHPYGISTPSRKDVDMTRVLKHKLRELGIELYDHLIVAHDAVYSMRENGLMPNMY